MKTFNLREQKIVKYIVYNRNSNTFVLANVFNQWFDQTGVSFNVDTGEIIYDLNSDVDVDRIFKDEHGIIEVALLVKYLVDKGYIYVIQDSKGEIDIKKLGRNFSGTNILHTLPKDIAKIIKQSLFRVFVTNDLIEFVNHDFQSIETRQLLSAVSQLTQAQKQLEIAQKQLATTEKQTNELQKQTNEVHEQTNKIQQQLDEAKVQTKLVEKQSQEAQEQTKSAKKQTYLAWWALICAIATFIATIIVPRCSNEDLYHDEILRHLDQTNTIVTESFENLNAHADSLIAIGEIGVAQTDSMIKLEQSILKVTNKTNGVLQSIKQSMLKLDKKQNN